jgi:protein SCO1/2
VRLAALAALALLAAVHPGLAPPVLGHGDAAPAVQAGAPQGVPQGVPLPLEIGGAYRLTDHRGEARTEADPEGRLQMVFFGYVNCPSICSVALPLMADAADLLAARGVVVTPVVITVDPARDSVAAMAAGLERIDGRIVGLTGTETELQVAWDAFGIERTALFEDPEYGTVFAHGSHIYLLDGAGRFLTLVPPILSAEAVAGIVAPFAD